MEERHKAAELPTGSIVDNRWKIEALMCKGGFGTVSYEVSDAKRPNERFHLKAEAIVSVDKEHDIPTFLNMEIKLLMALKAAHSKYYIGVESGGETGKIKYIVMGMHGKNLEEIRQQLPQKRFSLKTSLLIAKETMLALEEIHNVGFLHRDIKPANMVTGNSAANVRRVYLFNFDLCRKYLDEKKNVRITRNKVQFRGTPRYASIDALQGKEQGRVDDVWSWFQSIIEITVGKLPFSDLHGPSTVQEFLPWIVTRKTEAFSNSGVMLAGCPKSFGKINAHLRSLKVEDKPTYTVIYDAITETVTSDASCNDTVPVDWEHGAKSVSRSNAKMEAR